MMKTAGGGKAKGGEFERYCCKQLSLWLSYNKRGDLFWRSAMSGGRATVQFKRGGSNRTQLGDVTAISPQGSQLTDVFFIECKCVKNLNFRGMMWNKSIQHGLPTYWDKCCTEAGKALRYPMLIGRQNRFPEVVVLNLEGMTLLNLTQNRVAYFPYFGAHVVYFADFLKHAERPK